MARELIVAQEPTFHYQTFRIDKTHSLGHGAYGAVYKAKCDQLTCAAKVLHPIIVDPDNPGVARVMDRFKQECDFLQCIRHPNIVQYLCVTTDPESGLPVLVMELLDESLTKLLERSQHSLAYHIQVDICLDVALAVAYLHSNDIIHRDLSSNNVLIIARRRAKVVDFGVSKLAGRVNLMLTPLTTCPGTMVYMSPEALREPPRYTTKLDCFSEGVIMIQVCTRLWPNPGPRTQQVPDPRSPTGTMEMPVLDTERRKNHIDMIDPTHPLLPIATDCLNYVDTDRPSSEEICQALHGLKDSDKYRDNVQQHSGETQAKDDQIEIQSQMILNKDRSLQDKDLELHKKEHQLQEKTNQMEDMEYRLQDVIRRLEELNRQLEDKNRDLLNKEGQIQDQMHEINEKEKEIQEKDDQLQLQRMQHHEEKLHLEEEIEAQERKIQQERDKAAHDKERQILDGDCTIHEKIQQLEYQSKVYQDEKLQLQQERSLQERQLQDKDEALQEKDRQIQFKDLQLQERNRQLQDMNNDIQDKNCLIHDKNCQLAEQHRYHQEEKQKLQEEISLRDRKLQNEEKSIICQLQIRDIQVQDMKEQLENQESEFRERESQLLGNIHELQQQNFAHEGEKMSRDMQLEELKHQLKEQEEITADIQQASYSFQTQLEQVQEQLRQKEQRVKLLEEQERAMNERKQNQSALTPAPKVKDKPHEIVHKNLISLEWRNCSKAPDSMFMGAATVHGDIAYFLDYCRGVCSYNSKTQRWNQLPEYPYTGGCLAVVIGQLTAIGGYTHYNGQCINKVLTLCKKWEEIFPPMPSSRSKVAAASNEDHLIVAGGMCDARGDIKFSITTVEVMDTETLEWSTVENLPRPRGKASLTICGDALYVVGGWDGRNKISSVLSCSLKKLVQQSRWHSNDRSSAWREISSLPVYNSTPVCVNGELLAVGGLDEGKKVVSAVYKYNQSSNSWEIFSRMPTARFSCLVAALPTDELLVVGGCLYVNSFACDVLEIAKIILF